MNRESEIEIVLDWWDLLDGWLNRGGPKKSSLSDSCELLVNQMKAARRSGRLPAAWELIDRVKFLSSESKIENEVPEVRLKCAHEALQMGALKEVGKLLQEAVGKYTSHRHNYAIASWLLGCVDWILPGHQDEAILHWQRSLLEFNDLKLRHGANKDDEKWYRERHEEMLKALKLAIKKEAIVPPDDLRRRTAEWRESAVPSSLADTRPIFTGRAPSQGSRVASPGPSTTSPGASPASPGSPGAPRNPSDTQPVVPSRSRRGPRHPIRAARRRRRRALALTSGDLLRLYRVAGQITAGEPEPVGFEHYVGDWVEVAQVQIAGRPHRVVHLRGGDRVVNVLTRDHWVMQVMGDSMNGEGDEIEKGDYILIRPGPTAQNGEIVAILKMDEDTSATLKRFFHRGNEIFLVPNSRNPVYTPLIFPEDDPRIRIIGVALAVFKPA